MERYKELEKKLEEIQKNLDNQIHIIDNITDSNFHKNLINLMSSYPDSKELIQFIVDVNDKLETKNEMFKDIIYLSLKDILKVKQQAVMELMQELNKLEKHTPTPVIDTFKQYFTNKTFLIVIAFIIGTIGLFIIPDQVISLAKIIFGVK